jgi:hypothetical protein
MVDEEPPDFHAILDEAATVIDLSSHEEMNRVTNNSPCTAVGSKIEDTTTFEPAFLKDIEAGISNRHTLSAYRAPRPQQSGTPYPFKRAVYRPPLSLSILKFSFPRPVAATTMPSRLMPADGGSFSALSSQVATPLLSRDETLKKRDVSREEEPIVERFKREKMVGETLAGGEKTEGGIKGHQTVEAGYVDRRDELRRELLSLFKGRREPSQGQ